MKVVQHWSCVCCVTWMSCKKCVSLLWVTHRINTAQADQDKVLVRTSTAISRARALWAKQGLCKQIRRERDSMWLSLALWLALSLALSISISLSVLWAKENGMHCAMKHSMSRLRILSSSVMLVWVKIYKVIASADRSVTFWFRKLLDFETFPFFTVQTCSGAWWQSSFCNKPYADISRIGWA